MHLTDEQLNEYLDRETNDRAQIELHLFTCADCATRLNVLQSLFREIESLRDLALSPGFAVRVATRRSQTLLLPRALTLTVFLQAALALAALIVSAPFVMPMISSYVSGIPEVSLLRIFLQLQAEWEAWLAILSSLLLPTIPQIPVVDLSSLLMLLVVISVSLLWVIGNGLLLRKQSK